MSSDSIIYLDYNATTPLEPEVLTSIQEALSEAWGNPSSSHEAGKRAKAMIDQARKNVADMIGADPSEIIFTSGGTEHIQTNEAPICDQNLKANNMILQSAVQSFHDDPSVDSSVNGIGDSKQIPHIISSHMEHPAVTVMLEHLENTGQADGAETPDRKGGGAETPDRKGEEDMDQFDMNGEDLAFGSQNEDTDVAETSDKKGEVDMEQSDMNGEDLAIGSQNEDKRLYGQLLLQFLSDSLQT